MFLQISLLISLFECDLPASGWERGCVCFQCFQEETELDSGTSCVPVGGSPVQSHTQTLWGQPPGVQGRGAEEELAPPLVHKYTHPYIISLCLLHPAPCQVLIPQKLQSGGLLQVVHLLFYRLGNPGPQFTAPGHTAGPVLLYSGFLFTTSPNPSQYYRPVRSCITCF